MRAKSKIFGYVRIVLMVICLWVGITSTIQRFMCPRMTEVEAFLEIPKSSILNFKRCE